MDKPFEIGVDLQELVAVVDIDRRLSATVANQLMRYPNGKKGAKAVHALAYRLRDASSVLWGEMSPEEAEIEVYEDEEFPNQEAA